MSIKITDTIRVDATEIDYPFVWQSASADKVYIRRADGIDVDIVSGKTSHFITSNSIAWERRLLSVTLKSGGGA